MHVFAGHFADKRMSQAFVLISLHGFCQTTSVFGQLLKRQNSFLMLKKILMLKKNDSWLSSSLTIKERLLQISILIRTKGCGCCRGGLNQSYPLDSLCEHIAALSSAPYRLAELVRLVVSVSFSRAVTVSSEVMNTESNNLHVGVSLGFPSDINLASSRHTTSEHVTRHRSVLSTTRPTLRFCSETGGIFKVFCCRPQYKLHIHSVWGCDLLRDVYLQSGKRFLAVHLKITQWFNFRLFV